LKRLARFDELKLLTSEEDRFARIFTARDPSNGDRVFLHCYDLSAAPTGEAFESTERRARREFDVIRRFQKSPHLPSLVDSWQPLPNYAGEMYFFSLSDSAALPVAALKDDPGWTPARRRDFSVRALAALAEFAEGVDGPLLLLGGAAGFLSWRDLTNVALSVPLGTSPRRRAFRRHLRGR
jgi:hypothetical protein